MDFFEEINNLGLMHFIDLQEPVDIETAPANNIRIIIQSADGYGKRFSLYFEEYVGYSVISDFYTDSDFFEDDGKSTRKLFHMLTESPYLNYIKQVSKPEVYHYNDVDRLMHYALYCIDHVVSVASFRQPVIERIK